MLHYNIALFYVALLILGYFNVTLFDIALFDVRLFTVGLLNVVLFQNRTLTFQRIFAKLNFP